MDISKIPILGWILGELDNNAIGYGSFLAVVGIVFFVVVLGSIGVSQSSVVSWLFYTAPIWLPYLTFILFFNKWVEWVRARNVWTGGRVVLRIMLPPEVMKSPEAMEIFFHQVFLSGAADNLWQVYIDGKHAPIVSYEIVSRGGDINFYITVPEKPAQLLKDNLYAQYPGISVQEVSLDYTAEIPNDLDGWDFVSFHMNKKKDSHFPIKSYIDMGLDKLPKEEEKNDPITPLLEAMSTINPGHQMWVQILTKAHRTYNWKEGSLKKGKEWTEDAKATIDKIMQRDPGSKKGSIEEEGNPRLTPGERSGVESMERHLSKTPHDVAIRWCYMSPPDSKFDASNIPKMLRALAQTEVKGGNGIGMKWRTDFNYHWFSDPFGTKLPQLKKAELKEYKRRVLYPKSSAMGFKTFSAEELATLYHFPGTVALTPTLNRVGSTQGQAPNNLPTGILPR